MGLTSTLFTGLTGLNSSQARLDVIGDNIANVNTTGFKSSRVMFQTLFSQTVTGGTKPSATIGGTNPIQVGLGSVTGAIQRNFTAGSIETTGVPSDLAIEGNGFFVMRTPENERVFTRDGSFLLSAERKLISKNGFFVTGYGVDSNFNIVPGNLTDITIPIGTLTTARATSTARFDGTLNSGGTVGTQGSILQSQILHDTSGTPITGATLLSDVRNPGSLGTPLVAAGNTFTLRGAKQGGRDLPESTFTIGAGTTVQDFVNWLGTRVGINTDTGAAGSPGFGINGGRLELRGNAGTENRLELPLGTLLSDGSTQNPFAFTSAQEPNGESIHTSMIVYDSIGTPITVGLVGVLEGRTTGASTWRFYMNSANNAGSNFNLGSTVVEFDGNGRPVLPLDNSVLVNRTGTGAADPLVVRLDMSRLNGLATERSGLVMTFQDGFEAGTLVDFSVGGDGQITGTFSNGLTQTLGQLAVATFSNPAGLVARGNNVFFTGANSGDAQITPPLQLGAGRVLGGALELSNVDLSREFINMITASTSFSANSRVISTSDQLLQELLLLVRR